MTSCFKINISNFTEDFEESIKKEAISNLESGKILFFPNLNFALNKEESTLLEANNLDLKVKSIKYNPSENKIWGVKNLENEAILKGMLARYTQNAVNLVQNLLPFYKNEISIGNSSFRPIEAEGRKQSKRQDDTRLHIDAFPTRPMYGKRLIRVFANINQEGKPRIWNAGENFEDVAKKFLPEIPNPFPFSSAVMHLLRLTKTKRSKYDHFMLALHDKMKLNDAYQNSVNKERIEFNAGCVWVCFSDGVSHAALSGSGLLEQTIYLPAQKMLNPEKSPLYILERMLNTKLI